MSLPAVYFPHDAQWHIHLTRDYRFRTVCCGRRWGKTLSAVAEILDRAESGPAGDYAWIAPTYFIAERAIDAVRELAGDKVLITGRNPVRAEVKNVGGKSRVLFLSADNPESILGLGFEGIVIDEAARIDPDVWTFTIRPTLAQTKGWALLISTPNGRGWFYDMFTRGNDPDEKDFKSFKFPSYTSPYFPPEEWIEAKRTMPSDAFRQEYEAEFIEDSAGVFHGVDECLVDEIPPRMGEVATGCDVAKHTDFTVNIAMDRTTGACLDMQRFNQLDWPIQKERIVAFNQKWPGLLVLDATGAGDPIYDDLRHQVPNIEPFKFTNASKTQLIQRLIVAIEQKQISWPRAWTTLTDELKRYEYAIGANGTITYNAPGGYHDDCVIALALANSARFAHMRSGEIKVFAPRNAAAEGGGVAARTLGSRPRGAPGKGRGRILF